MPSARVLGFVLAVAAGAATAGEGHAPHWGYGEDDGPGHWAELSPDWRLCAAGGQQAPIDIEPARATAERAETAVLELKGRSHRIDLRDNGHTLQAGDAGATVLTLGDSRYELVQFHFHAPSEHTLSGRAYAMELHLVHRRADGALAVVGVLVEEGDANPVLARLWAALPREAGAHRQLDVAFDLSAVLPGDRTAFRYQGSLTTPPCSEGVEWTVLARPVTASREQIRAFAARFGDDHRPTQPGNGRDVSATVLTVR